MRLILLLTSLLLTFVPSGAKTKDLSLPGQEHLIIFYTNDIIGETEPCG